MVKFSKGKYISCKAHFQRLSSSNSPPLSARLRNAADSTYNFLGLYVTSLFSVGPSIAIQIPKYGPAHAQNSSMPTPPLKLPRSTSGDHLALLDLALQVEVEAEAVVMEAVVQVVAEEAVGRG